MATERSKWRFWKDDCKTDLLAFFSIFTGGVVPTLIGWSLGMTLGQLHTLVWWGLLFLTLWFSLCFCVLADQRDTPRPVLASLPLMTIFFGILLGIETYLLNHTHQGVHTAATETSRPAFLIQSLPPLRHG